MQSESRAELTLRSRAEFMLRSRAETAAWGAALGRRLRPGDVIALIGDLGAGKTTLAQAMARGMGIAEPVTSPTFTLIQEYPGRVPMFHFDPYRLEHPEEMADLGFDEYCERDGVIVIEWADRVSALLPAERLTLRLAILSEDAGDADAGDTPRRLTAVAVGSRSAALLAAMRALPEIQAMRAEQEADA
jgi:tRNA threonylcarbamoyladenosine biosynthesis protein TsaE